MITDLFYPCAAGSKNLLLRDRGQMTFMNTETIPSSSLLNFFFAYCVMQMGLASCRACSHPYFLADALLRLSSYQWL